MKTFLKVNFISILYAFIIFIPIELFINVSRITRLAGGEFDFVSIVLVVAAILSVILFSVFVYKFTTKWLFNRFATYWTVLLWLPYLIVLVFIFASMFPVTNPADEGGPGDGIIVLGLLLFYPLYILILNTFSTFSSEAD